MKLLFSTFLIGALLLQPVPAEDVKEEKCIKVIKSNIHFGKLFKNDKELHSGTVELGSKWLQIVSEDVTVQLPPEAVIRFMSFKNEENPNEGSCVFISEGGIGENFVKLHFRSSRGRGIHFQYRIYGFQPYKKRH